MPKAPFANLLQYLRHLYPADAGGNSADGELLDRFIRAHDEEAFTALVQRHGSMVMGVCRRLLGDRHLAEDSFQATFIVLARRAKGIRSRTSLGTWLYAVAQRVALKARAKTTAWRNRERQSSIMAGREPIDEHTWQELRSILDEEIARLPEKYQSPLVLCYLESKSHDRAAKELGCAKTTLERRLSRGRELLRKQLIRRGVTLSAGVLAAALGEKAMAARVGVSLVIKTAQAAVGVVAGKGVVVGSLTARAVALAEETLAGMAGITANVVVGVIVIGMAIAGAGLAGYARSKENSQPGLLEKAQRPLLAKGEGIASPTRKLVDAVDERGDPLPYGAVARFGSSRLRIGNSAFALTPDGKFIITVSPEGVVRKFDGFNGRLLERRQFDRSDVDATGQGHAQISADGKRAMIAEPSKGSHRLAVWDVCSGKILFRPTPAPRRGFGLPTAALSPDGNRVAVSKWNEEDDAAMLCVYDVKSGRAKEVGRIELNTYDMQFSSDGTRVAVSQVSMQGTSTFAYFDVLAGKQLWQLPRTAERFALSPDGKMVVSATGGVAFRIIETDPATGKPTEHIKPYDRQAHPNVPLIIAPDNRTLVMNHFGEIVRWDLQTGKEITRLKASGRASADPNFGAMSLDSRTLITNLGYLQRWDLTTGKPFFDAPPAIASSVKDLDSDVFDAREKANRKLREYGAKAEPTLRRALIGSPSLEMKRRIEGILTGIVPTLPAMIPLPVSGDTLRKVRVIEVLERVNARESRSLLRTWAEHADDKGLAAEAKAAIERIGE